MRTTIASFKSTGYIFLSTPTAAENSGFVPSLSLSLSPFIRISISLFFDDEIR